jgi:hypothetical protein
MPPPSAGERGALTERQQSLVRAAAEHDIGKQIADVARSCGATAHVRRALTGRSGALSPWGEARPLTRPSGTLSPSGRG